MAMVEAGVTARLRYIERLIDDMEAKRSLAEKPSPLRLMLLGKILDRLKAERDRLQRKRPKRS